MWHTTTWAKKQTLAKAMTHPHELWSIELRLEPCHDLLARNGMAPKILDHANTTRM